MKKSFAKVFLALGIAGFAGQGMADYQFIDQDLVGGQTVSTGAELTISCIGSLTNLENPAGINGRQDLTYVLASGAGAAGTPGALYTGTDQFHVDASCKVDLSIACAPSYDAGDATCDMVREAPGVGGPVAPASAASAADKIEDVIVSFNNQGDYLDLELHEASGVTNTNVDLKYQAALGGDSSDNKAGTYRVDIDITAIEFP